MKLVRRSFGIFHDIFGIHDKNSQAYIAGSVPPYRPLPNHSEVVRQDLNRSQQVSVLPNGVRVLTESQGLPSVVHLGVTIASGTRDETSASSGLVHALSSTYLKTNIRTNEQINYAMVQMSGGDFKMTYSQDFMNYFGHCLAHDTYDMLQMLSDCVLDEKTVMDEEASHWRLDEYWKFRNANITNWQRLDELWLSTAYGFKGYGMPLSGFESNFQNLSYYYMNKWRKQFATPGRMIVWAAGIQDHAEFVKIVTPYFGCLDKKQASQREPSKYMGGEHKELVDSVLTNISLSLKAPCRNNQHLAAAFVLKYLVGKAGTLNRGNLNLKQKFSEIKAFEADHAAFEDTGNFNLKFAVENNAVSKVTEAVVNEINGLANVSEEEVRRAKSLLIAAVNRRGLDPSKRMLKNAQMLAYTGNLTSTEDFVKCVETVDATVVKDMVNTMKKSYPTLVVIGSNTHEVPSVETIYSKLVNN